MRYVAQILEGLCLTAVGANLTLGVLFNDPHSYLAGVLCLTAAMISASNRHLMTFIGDSGRGSHAANKPSK
jgi:hypothetical protein